ncbi:MAG: ABC transporter substrate-binding protein [Christensenella sp.]|nr:ABC transporter substrate-binding protein [Christensenella sp.]
MKKVKVLALFLVVAMVFAFAACGANQTAASETAAAEETQAAATEAAESAATEATESAAAEETVSEDMVDTTAFKKDGPYTIGFSDIQVVNTWRAQMHNELDAAAEEYGVTLYTTDAGGDTSKQVSDIQDLIARGIDALLVAPGSTTATNAVTRQAIQQGIPVFMINAEVDDPEAYTGYVGSNNVDFGYNTAKWLLNEIGGKGNIIVLNGIAGNSTSTLREDGFKKALEELPDGGENINILATYYADWAYDKGKQSAEQALAAYPQIDAVWSQGGAMSQGVIEAFQAAGRDLVPITGEDNNGYLKMWNELLPTGFVSIATSDPSWESRVALETALNALAGKPVIKDNYITVPIITNDNLSEYVKPEYSDAYWCSSKLPKEKADELYLEQ